MTDEEVENKMFALGTIGFTITIIYILLIAWLMGFNNLFDWIPTFLPEGWINENTL